MSGIRIAVVGRYPLLNSYISTLLAVHPGVSNVRDYITVDQLLNDHDLEVDILVMLVDQHTNIAWSSVALAQVRFSVRQRLVIVEQGCQVPQDVLQTSVTVPMSLEQTTLEILVAEFATNRFYGMAFEAIPDLYLTPCLSIFTRKQKQVLSFLRTGMSNKQIAFKMGLTESTIKIHMRRIFSKTGCRCRIDAALMANRFRFDQHQTDHSTSLITQAPSMAARIEGCVLLGIN